MGIRRAPDRRGVQGTAGTDEWEWRNRKRKVAEALVDLPVEGLTVGELASALKVIGIRPTDYVGHPAGNTGDVLWAEKACGIGPGNGDQKSKTD